jgi:hypothetical protein
VSDAVRSGILREVARRGLDPRSLLNRRGDGDLLADRANVELRSQMPPGSDGVGIRLVETCDGLPLRDNQAGAGG